MPSRKKILGVIGGMGPAATCNFFSKIIALTPASKDKDHLEIVIHNNTRIPDRTDAILKGEESPVIELNRSLDLLIGAGADVIAIPCITAHYFLPYLSESAQNRIINAVDETISLISEEYPGTRNVGILATNGTISARIFHGVLERFSLLPIVPSPHFQSLVMDAIYGPRGIKAGNTGAEPNQNLTIASHHLVEKGAEVLIAGCTEIPLALNQNDTEVPVIDPMDILARRAIDICLDINE